MAEILVQVERTGVHNAPFSWNFSPSVDGTLTMIEWPGNTTINLTIDVNFVGNTVRSYSNVSSPIIIDPPLPYNTGQTLIFSGSKTGGSDYKQGMPCSEEGPFGNVSGCQILSYCQCFAHTLWGNIAQGFLQIDSIFVNGVDVVQNPNITILKDENVELQINATNTSSDDNCFINFVTDPDIGIERFESFMESGTSQSITRNFTMPGHNISLSIDAGHSE